MSDTHDNAAEAPPFPAVIVRRLADAQLAIAAAADIGCGVTLLSAPGASAALGVGGFEALAAAARATYPRVPVVTVIDCADRPGDALAALRHGFQWIRCSADGPAGRALAGAAGARGARILTVRPPALDLDLDRFARDFAALDRWLRDPAP